MMEGEGIPRAQQPCTVLWLLQGVYVDRFVKNVLCRLDATTRDFRRDMRLPKIAISCFWSAKFYQ